MDICSLPYMDGLNDQMRIMLDDGAYMPVRAHESDAGLDLRTPKAFMLCGHSSAVIDTGIHVEIPCGCYGRLESKSGLHIWNDIVCLGGTIDEGYTGSIRVKLYNLGEKDYEFEAGDKVTQLVILPCLRPQLVLDTEFVDTDRGSNGFGSSGR